MNRAMELPGGFTAIQRGRNKMKSSTEDDVKRKPREVKGKAKREIEKLNDPTLEGIDENRVGRVQEKTG